MYSKTILGLLLILSVPFAGFASDEDFDPIVVKLATESSLSPLYIIPLVNEGSELQENYLRQLEQVLTFDLNHNGSTAVAKSNPTADNIGLKGSSDQLGNVGDWKSQNVYYVVKGRVRGNNLSLLVLDVNKQNIKSTDNLPLTGNLNEDRRTIHKLADTVHKALFGVDGIASTHIIYSQKMPDRGTKPVSEIWEADYDGANARQLTNGGFFSISPVYLPPKPGFLTGGFMYISYEIGQPKIYVSSFKDPKPRRLTYMRGNQFMPAISRNRDKIAFISDITGNPDLFVQPFSPDAGIQEKPFQAFSAKQATQGSPTFSPDGKRIALVSNKDGSPRIYVITIPEPGMSLKDVKPILISKVNRENSAPCWSPDGTKIAFCAKASGDRQIWMYDFTTNKEKQLTSGPGNKENPSWASNNLHLVYNTSDGDASDLYIINLNQHDATKISSGKGEKRFPNWEPRIK
ncbi:MAG: Tol-Pal system protein TolB [Parachlamydiaceae bacterium]|nr:Tol-Pal system protein TolB [Parachlamydiaceae bacterium]